MSLFLSSVAILVTLLSYCSSVCSAPCFFFFFNDTVTTEIYTLSLHDALQISYAVFCLKKKKHTSELQSRSDLVCRLLLEKTNTRSKRSTTLLCSTPSLLYATHLI